MLTISKPTYTSAEATRGTSDTVCVFHTTALIQPSCLINPVSMSAQELQLPAGESPGDPRTHQLLVLVNAAKSAAWPRLKSVSSLDDHGPKPQLERKCWAASFLIDKI